MEQRSSQGRYSSSEKHADVTNREGRSLSRQDAQISNFPKDSSTLAEFTPGSILASTDMQSPIDSQGKSSRWNARKKKEEIKTVKSENIPGHRGSESNLDDLLDFIENNHGGKKKKKILPVQNGPQTVLDKEKDKNNIKKIKKGKLPLNKDSSDRAGSDYGSDKGEEQISCDHNNKTLSKLVTENSSSIDLKDSMVPLTKTGEDPQSPAGLTLDVFNADGGYIFTDFDNVPPVEEEFQVVSKPKKKKQQQQQRSGPSPHGSYRESSLDFTREDRGRSRRPMRSITPPPTPTTSQEKPSERAFSPSAFPVLSGRPREGRRNSTGNAPCEANLDDSDMESVKSLPLVAGSSSTSNKTSCNTSPGSGRPQVISYAKIAAAPKPNKGSLNSSCSNAAGIINTSVKGNASGVPLVKPNANAERRHSLDSIPQPECGSVVSPIPVDYSLGNGNSVDNTQGETIVINKEFPPPSTLTSVVALSQEESVHGYLSSALPKSDSENDAISVTSNTSSNSRSVSVSESRPKEETVEPGPVIKLDLDADFPHISKNVSVNNKFKATATQQPKLTKNNIGNNKKQTATARKDTTNQNVIVGDSNIMKDKVSVASNLTFASTENKLDSVSVESDVVTSKPPLAPKVTNNHRKVKIQKPVYFLDNKMNKPHKDLGISFGFDHDLSSPVQDILVDKKEVSSDMPVDNGVLPAEDASLKLKEGLTGLNGLVVVHTNTQGATTTSSLNPCSQAKPNIKIKGSSSPIISDGLSTHVKGPWHTGMPYAPPAPNMCMPQFGDVKISHYTTRRPPPHDEDPNYNCDRFNVEETVMFLKREWDRVMEKKAKDPRRVLCYSCD